MQQQHRSSQIVKIYNVYVNPYGMRRLSPKFEPGCFDVLCARGKLAYNHEGNRHFRVLVMQHEKQYSAATCKYEKSKIVSYIVSAVRNASPLGGFVKNIDGAWHEVGDRHAKEKVGQTFRDLLHTKYSSSTKAKARARVQRRMKDLGQKDADSKESPVKHGEPETVRSSRAHQNEELMSSISIVSDGSVDGDSLDTTFPSIKRSCLPLPFVKSEGHKQVHKRKHYLPHVSPADSRRKAPISLLDPLPLTQNPGLAPPMQIHVPMHPDLEPLPLGASVQFRFNESSRSTKTEESFEDIMSEFYQNMTVAL